MSRRKRGVAPQPTPGNNWSDVAPYLKSLDSLCEFLSIPAMHRILKRWNERDLTIVEKHERVISLLACEGHYPGWLAYIYEYNEQ